MLIGSLLPRLDVWRRRSRLDRALAEGADPGADPALALRAIAGTLRKLVAAAEEPNDPLSTRAPVQREAVLAARNELVYIAHVFSGPEEVTPQAVALAVLMVWDSASPLGALPAFA